MTIDLDRLEAVAKAATPGPWNPSPGRALVVSRVDISEPVICNCLSEQFAQAPKDAAFIAAVSPDVVLELVAELRKAKAERDWLAKRIALDGVSCPIEPNVCAGTCEDHIQCWLEAARDAIEEQKP